MEELKNKKERLEAIISNLKDELSSAHDDLIKVTNELKAAQSKYRDIKDPHDYSSEQPDALIVDGVEVKASKWKGLFVAVANKYSRGLTLNEFFEIFKSADGVSPGTSTSSVCGVRVVNNYSANNIIKILSKLLDKVGAHEVIVKIK